MWYIAQFVYLLILLFAYFRHTQAKAGDTYMTRDAIKDLILEIIEDIDEDADFDALESDKPLRDQLDLDSMDFLDIVMELRKRHNLQIPEEDYPELATLDSCVNYLEPLLADA